MKEFFEPLLILLCVAGPLTGGLRLARLTLGINDETKT